MHDSIHKYLKVGNIQMMANPGLTDGDAIVASIRKFASDDYYDALEITHIADSKAREQARDILAQSHMTVCYVASPRLMGAGLSINDLNEEGRKKAEAVVIDSIDEGEYMGAKAVAMLAGPYEEATKDQSYAQLLKTLRNVCDYAKTKGMNIELEVFDFDVDKKALIGPAPYAYQLASDMRTSHNNFGLLVDLSHIPLTYETPKFVLRTLRPFITHFHIGNGVLQKGAVAYGDTHPRFGFPNSTSDTPALLDFLRVMKEEGFLDVENPPIMSFEVKPWTGEDWDVVEASSKRVLNRAWALLED